MDRVTKNLSKADIEERIAKLVREHTAADRDFRDSTDAFWACCCGMALTAVFLFLALRG